MDENCGFGDDDPVPRVPTGESSIARAVRILESFTTADESLTVSQIALRSGLHIATASRLISELSAHGLLERGPHREVRVGVRLWELARRSSPALSLRDAAMPYLEDLHAIVGQHAQLGVLDGGEVLYLERLSAPDAVLNYTRIAGRLPVHASASGHVLAAYGSPEVREQILSRQFERYTAQTIVTADALNAALELVRQQGYSFLEGHLHPAATGMAARVRNGLGEVVASMAVVVPSGPRSRAALPALLAAARGASRRMAAPEKQSFQADQLWRHLARAEPGANI